jgi:hypothetical protein
MESPVSLSKRIARHLLAADAIGVSLRRLSATLVAWLDLANSDEMRSLLTDSGKAKPPEWQQEYRFNLHLAQTPIPRLRELVTSLFVTETFYTLWKMRSHGTRAEQPGSSNTELPHDLATDPAPAAFGKELSLMPMPQALGVLAEATILWAHSLDPAIIRADAIATQHYDESEGHDGLVNHAMRSYYMYFTGA